MTSPSAARPPRRVLAELALHTFFLEASFNPERRQGLGAASALLPVAGAWPEGPSRVAFYERHLERFNTNPPFSGLVLGAVARVEVDAAAGDETALKRLPRIKRALEAPFAAVGDALFWNGIRPVAALLGSAAALIWGGAGAVLFLVLYNLIHIPTRIGGVIRGYGLGADVGRVLRAPFLVRVQRMVPALVPVVAFLVVAASLLGPTLDSRQVLWGLLAAGVGVWGGRTGRLDGARLGGGVIMVGFLIALWTQ